MINYKIYIELGNHNCIHKMLSTAFYTKEELEERGAIYIDTVSLKDDDDTSNGQYLQNTCFVDKYGKPVLDEDGKSNFKYESDKITKLSDEEKEEWFIKPQEINAEKERQQKMLEDMMKQAQQVSFLNELSDEQATTIPYCYDEWQTDKLYKVGDRVQADGKLWKCRQEHTSQENWQPSIETASLWEVINEQHAGTLEDPIPYDQTMTVYKDKYYIEDGIIYKCLEDSGQPLYASCKDLPRYFEAAKG